MPCCLPGRRHQEGSRLEKHRGRGAWKYLKEPELCWAQSMWEVLLELLSSWRGWGRVFHICSSFWPRFWLFLEVILGEVQILTATDRGLIAPTCPGGCSACPWMLPALTSIPQAPPRSMPSPFPIHTQGVLGLMLRFPSSPGVGEAEGQQLGSGTGSQLPLVGRGACAINSPLRQCRVTQGEQQGCPWQGRSPNALEFPPGTQHHNIGPFPC